MTPCTLPQLASDKLARRTSKVPPMNTSRDEASKDSLFLIFHWNCCSMVFLSADFLASKCGVSEGRASALRVEHFRSHGSSLAGLLVLHTLSAFWIFSWHDLLDEIRLVIFGPIVSGSRLRRTPWRVPQVRWRPIQHGLKRRKMHWRSSRNRHDVVLDLFYLMASASFMGDCRTNWSDLMRGCGSFFSAFPSPRSYAFNLTFKFDGMLCIISCLRDCFRVT